MTKGNTGTAKYYAGDADKAKHLYLKKEPRLASVGEFHDSVEFVFVLEGEIEAHIDQEVSTITEGGIVFADSYACHYYKNITPSICAFVLVLSREYLSLFREAHPKHTFVPFMTDKEKNKKVMALMQSWFDESKKSYLLDHGFVNLLLAYLVEAYGLVKNVKQKKPSIVKEILTYIHENYTEDISLKSMSKALGFSEEYCSKEINKATGCGFRQYVNFLRIKKAERLLSDETVDMTMVEILYKCGFNSPVTYYRARKRFHEKN